MNSAIVSPEDRQAIVDEEQLRLLAIAQRRIDDFQRSWLILVETGRLVHSVNY